MKTPKAQQKKNTGKQYELRVKSLYESILALHGDEFKNIRVKHNVHLESISARSKDGTSIKRQIDVYWEFELAGTVHRVCVQTKDMDRRVTLGMVDTFRSVLDDIAGQPRGIIVSRKGYQKGAEAFAKARGIDILVFSEIPETETPSKVDLQFSLLAMGISKIEFTIDLDWVKERGIPTDTAFSLTKKEKDLFLLNEDGTPKVSLTDLFNQVRPDADSVGFHVAEILFDSPTFLPTGLTKYPLVKVKSFKMTVFVWEAVQPTRIYRYVNHLFFNATGGKNYEIDNSGIVRKAGEQIELEQSFSFSATPVGEKTETIVLYATGSCPNPTE